MGTTTTGTGGDKSPPTFGLGDQQCIYFPQLFGRTLLLIAAFAWKHTCATQWVSTQHATQSPGCSPQEPNVHTTFTEGSPPSLKANVLRATRPSRAWTSAGSRASRASASRTFVGRSRAHAGRNYRRPIAHARDASLTSSQWRIQKFSKGGRKNLLAPTLIYRKCTQPSVCLYTEKDGFLREKKSEPIGGRPLNLPLPPATYLAPL